jgi:peptidoglycan/xylan/chitin deacetylase (PgdA/CDA1 family)
VKSPILFRAAAMTARSSSLVGRACWDIPCPTNSQPASIIALAAAALNRIGDFTGEQPRGWLGPGLQETEKTPDLLRELGVRYVCDWVLDDLPAPLETAHGPLVALPYALELNDSVVFAVEKQVAGEFERRVRATAETFAAEFTENPRVLTLALHPHLIGVPHRIGALSAALDALLARDDTTFVTGSGIVDWYVRQTPEVFGPARAV